MGWRGGQATGRLGLASCHQADTETVITLAPGDGAGPTFPVSPRTRRNDGGAGFVVEGLYPMPTPCVLGHEASAVVEAVGSAEPRRAVRSRQSIPAAFIRANSGRCAAVNGRV